MKHNGANKLKTSLLIRDLFISTFSDVVTGGLGNLGVQLTITAPPPPGFENLTTSLTLKLFHVRNFYNFIKSPVILKILLVRLH